MKLARSLTAWRRQISPPLPPPGGVLFFVAPRLRYLFGDKYLFSILPNQQRARSDFCLISYVVNCGRVGKYNMRRSKRYAPQSCDQRDVSSQHLSTSEGDVERLQWRSRLRLEIKDQTASSITKPSAAETISNAKAVSRKSDHLGRPPVVALFRPKKKAEVAANLPLNRTHNVSPPALLCVPRFGEATTAERTWRWMPERCKKKKLVGVRNGAVREKNGKTTTPFQRRYFSIYSPHGSFRRRHKFPATADGLVVATSHP
jgi:hypothetical protein